MNFIQCARNKQEQNLKALQHNGCLYFEATRDVAVGEELLVWYDETQYDLYMGIPTGYRPKLGEDKQPGICIAYTYRAEHLSIPYGIGSLKYIIIASYGFYFIMCLFSVLLTANSKLKVNGTTNSQPNSH